MRMININHKYFKGNKSAATLVTFMVSAFWHGFYPVYYFFFFQFFLLERISEILEDLGLFVYLERQNLVIKFFAKIAGMAFCNYLGIVFVLLTFENVYLFIRNMYFIPPIALVLVYVVVTKIKKKYGKKNQKKGEDTKDGKLEEVTKDEKKE
jgi:lysophospholipid acyltransferase